MWSPKFGGTKYGEGRELIAGSLLATGNPQVEENFSQGNSKLGVEGKGHMSTEPGRRPPSLLHLSINTAALHINRLSNLVSIRIPDSIIEELFEKTLAAGKLTEPVLRMFLATGNAEVLQMVQSLRIRPIYKPVLPTRCSEKTF